MTPRFALSSFALLTLLLLPASLRAADYRVEPLAEPPPSDEIAEEIVAQLSQSGARIIRGTKTEFCDIWLCKDLAVTPDFKESPAIAYPFTPGQLVGVVRYSRDGADFRDQEIEDGVYTVRFALQPVDGAHVGTSLTRDFLLLVSAEADRAVAPMEYDALIVASAEAAGTSHPCMLALKKPLGIPEAEPQIRHDEDHDWWIVSLRGSSGEKPLAVEVVVVGVGAE